MTLQWFKANLGDIRSCLGGWGEGGGGIEESGGGGVRDLPYLGQRLYGSREDGAGGGGEQDTQDKITVGNGEGSRDKRVADGMKRL